MSAETLQAVEDAIAAHLADENDGAMLQGWVALAAGQNIEQLDKTQTTYRPMAGFTTPFDRAMGLAQYLVNDLTTQQAINAYGGPPPDEDES